jgi:hypothetical protein
MESITPHDSVSANLGYTHATNEVAGKADPDLLIQAVESSLLAG